MKSKFIITLSELKEHPLNPKNLKTAIASIFVIMCAHFVHLSYYQVAISFSEKWQADFPFL